jgi:hypothetical protein
MDVVCPILKTNDQAPVAAVTPQPSTAPGLEQQLTGSEAVTDNSYQSGGFDEGFIQIKNTRIYGMRTYSIILVIVLVYSYLCIKAGDALGMKDLALMACGFLFGTKTFKH